MTRFGLWPLYGLLLALALALGLAAGAQVQVSPVPRVDNPGPRGLKVLWTWLSESGFDVRPRAEGLEQLDDDVRTVVIPAPTASRLTAGEADVLRAFLARGGTLVALVPRTSPGAPLRELLSLGSRQQLSVDPTSRDPGGATLRVLHRRGALSNVSQLRVAGDTHYGLTRRDAVPMTDPPAVWWFREGPGEVYVATGADLAENSRLDLADNAQVWLTLAARGPLWIDESHHEARAAQAPSTNLWAALLQFGFAALVFVAAVGARLGPPRDERATVHRSGLEYVDAMAHLTQRAGIESELVESLRRDVRRRLHEDLGMPLDLPDEERARGLATALAMPVDEARALFTDPDFLSLSRRLAALEARLSGKGA